VERKVALVTGGTRGIGAAIADIYEGKGYFLVLTGTDRIEISERNKKCSSKRVYVQVDFNENDSFHRFLKYVSELERLDVCINNAGINIIKMVEDVTEAELSRITKVNYHAPYMISQSASNVMKRGEGGHIVNIASIWSLITKPGRSLYCGVKAGLAGMTRALGTDLAKDNILVNCVSPGFTMTDLTRSSLSSKELASLSKQIPLRRLAEPSEVAELVYFLGNPKNTYITGQNITIDGGFVNV